MTRGLMFDVERVEVLKGPQGDLYGRNTTAGQINFVSKKPTEVRMGKGKGSPEFWAAKVKPGRIMFEIDGVPEPVARRALELGAAKLPLKTRIVTRIGG